MSKITGGVFQSLEKVMQSHGKRKGKVDTAVSSRLLA
jgi:hypothetical protein